MVRIPFSRYYDSRRTYRHITIAICDAASTRGNGPLQKGSTVFRQTVKNDDEAGPNILVQVAPASLDTPDKQDTTSLQLAFEQSKYKHAIILL